MKILFLGEPDSANTKAWVSGLAGLGCTVEIASARPGASADVHPIGHPALPPRLRILTGLPSLRRIIRKVSPDIIIGYRVTSYGWLAAASGFKPLAVAVQNERIVDDEGSAIRRFILSRCARRAIADASFLHAWSPNMLEGLKRFGDCEAKTLVMHRGIDCSMFNPSGRTSPKDGIIRIVSTRSLYPIYNLAVLLEAFAAFAAEFPGATLDIAGEGPLRPELERQSVNLGVSSKVKFHGRLKPGQVANLLKQSDIYASLTETEGLSSSLLEACACGVLPIVMDMPASRCLISEPSSGILLKTLLKTSLVEAFKKAAGAEFRANAVASNAANISQNYDRDKNLAAFISHYERLIRESKGRVK